MPIHYHRASPSTQPVLSMRPLWLRCRPICAEASCLLLAELPLKTAVRLAAEISGAPHNTLDEAALALKNQGACAEPVPAGPSRTMPWATSTPSATTAAAQAWVQFQAPPKANRVPIT